MQEAAPAHLGTLLPDEASPRHARGKAISHHEGGQRPSGASVRSFSSFDSILPGRAPHPDFLRVTRVRAVLLRGLAPLGCTKTWERRNVSCCA